MQPFIATLTSCSTAQVRGNTVKLCTAGDRLNQCLVWYVTRRLTSCSRAQVKGKMQCRQNLGPRPSLACHQEIEDSHGRRHIPHLLQILGVEVVLTQRAQHGNDHLDQEHCAHKHIHVLL